MCAAESRADSHKVGRFEDVDGKSSVVGRRAPRPRRGKFGPRAVAV